MTSGFSNPATPISYRNTRRGSVVIFVLGIILLAAFLITRLMDRAAVELAAESKASKRAELRQEAMSALEASLAVLADESLARQGLHDVSEGWNQPLALMDYHPSTGYRVETVVEDESGKLSLSQIDDNTLRAYLDAIGCPATSLDLLVDALLAWTRPDYLSDRDGINFSNAALPYEAPLRALRSFGELLAIPAVRDLFFDPAGDWNELGRRFRAGVSLFSFRNSNVNSAPPEVLLARGLDEAQVTAILMTRENRGRGSSFYRSAGELAGVWGGTAAPAGMGTDVLCWHIIITTWFGARNYRLDAWVTRGATSAPGNAAGGARRATTDNTDPAVAVSVRNNPRKSVDYPFQILELRENDGT